MMIVRRSKEKFEKCDKEKRGFSTYKYKQSLASVIVDTTSTSTPTSLT